MHEPKSLGYYITYIYTHIYIYIYIYVRVFANGLGELSSILNQVIPKTQQMTINVFLLSTQHYKIRIKGKWSNPWKEKAPFPTLWCCNNWKGSLGVVLDYGRPTYFFTIYISKYLLVSHVLWVLIWWYIYMCVCVCVCVCVFYRFI